MTPCFSWGAGTQGQLGNGTWQDALEPTAVQQLPEQGILHIACGANHAVCLTGTKPVYVWGSTHFGNSNNSSDDLKNITAAASNQVQEVEQKHQQGSHWIAPTETGTTAVAQAQATGSNAVARIPALCCLPQLLTLPSPEITVTQVAAGWEHTVMLTDNAQLFVAGDNQFGQLGLGRQVQATSQLVLLDLWQVAADQQRSEAQGQQLQYSGARVVNIAAGMRHSLALLHVETPKQQQEPEQQLPCGICSNLQMHTVCNGAKELQQDTRMDSNNTSCATVTIGWGVNKRHQLGPARNLAPLASSSSFSLKPANAANAIDASASTGKPGCTTSGVNSRSGVVWHPSVLTGLHGAHVVQLAAGGERSAGITREGRLLLWGRPLPSSSFAAAADASYVCLPQPSKHQAWISDQSSTSSTSRGMLLQPVDDARAPSTTAWMAGQRCMNLQVPTASVNSSQPQASAAAAINTTLEEHQMAWYSVCLGWRHLVALDSAGQVWSAGDNSLGQLGVGTSEQQRQQLATQAAVALSSKHLPPTADGLHVVQLPTAARCIAAGAEHSVAVLSNGSVWAWGWGEHGQLGTGSTDNETIPKQVLVTQQPSCHSDADAGCSAGGRAHVAASSGPSVSEIPDQLFSWQPTGVACGSGFTVVW